MWDSSFTCALEATRRESFLPFSSPFYRHRVFHQQLNFPARSITIFSRLVISKLCFLFLLVAWTTMPSWHVNLFSHSGKQLDSHEQYVTSTSHATVFIDGDTANDDTWRFVDYGDETQARRDWVSQFGEFIYTLFVACHHVCNADQFYH